MTTLEKIIEEKAYKLFKTESGMGFNGMKDAKTRFMLKNASVYEYAEFLKAWSIRESKIGDAIVSAMTDRYCEEKLWPMMKDSYINRVVLELEKRISITELPTE